MFTDDFNFYATVDSNNADPPTLQVSEGQSAGLPENYLDSFLSFIK